MKKIRSSLALSLIMMLVSTLSYATIWETASQGFWDSPSIWVNGTVPDTTSGDTFYIKHPIVVTNDLVFEEGAYVVIEENGGLCGHQKATVLKNAQIISYGVLELDDLLVNSGFVHCLAGKVILTTSARIMGTGAKVKIDSVAYLAVGPWFDCVLPNYAFLLDETLSTNDSKISSGVKIYPNPFSSTITIENGSNELLKSENTRKVIIYDCIGKEAFNALITGDGINDLDLSFLSNGMYRISISNEAENLSATIIKH